MTADQPIDVQRFIDARGLSPVQILILVLCFLVVAVDGFDAMAIAFIAPALGTEWGRRRRSSRRRSEPGPSG